MHIWNGLFDWVSEEPIEKINCTKKDELISCESQYIEGKSHILERVSREEWFSEILQWLMNLNSFDEKNPTDKTCFIREHDVSKDHTGNNLEFGVARE